MTLASKYAVCVYYDLPFGADDTIKAKLATKRNVNLNILSLQAKKSY